MVMWDDYKGEDVPGVSKGNITVVSVACPKCGKPLVKRTDIYLLSNPPKYRYFCASCGWHGVK